MGLCALGSCVLARAQRPPPPSCPPAAQTCGPISRLALSSATDNSREPGWVPLSLASVSSFGKSGRLEKFLETHLPAMSQRSGETMGVSLLPSLQAAWLGPVQLALAGCQSPGGGHQLVGAEALEPVAPGAAAAGKVTPLSSPAAGGRAAGGTALLPPRGTCPAHLLLSRGRGLPGQWDRAVGVLWWEGSFIGFVRISLPQLACSQTHPAPGKRALLTSPGPALRTSGCPPGERGHSGTLVSPPPPQPTQEPWARPGPLAGAGPSLPTNGLLGWLPFHQARSEVLGAPAWSQGLDPDHKARDPPGISREMLLAKPLGAPGARQETSLPSLWLPCPRQDRPRGLESGTVQPEVSSQRTGPAWLLGSVWTSLRVPLPAVGLGFQSPAPPHSQAGGGSLTGAGNASPVRSCRKQVNSLTVGIFSDVPSQGTPRENHHAHLQGKPLAQDRSWMGAGCPPHCCPEVPVGGLSIL